MIAIKQQFFKSVDAMREILLILGLILPLHSFTRREASDQEILVAMTSYPERIKRTWLAVETLLRQTLRPEKIVLVLSSEEFPEKKLPRRIRRQQKRGLEILWVNEDGKSFDKLIPLKLLHPWATIITFDDDKYFPRDLLEALVTVHKKFPHDVVGARGWVVRRSSPQARLAYGEGWFRAQPGERGRHLFMPGGNGTLYPASSLDEGVTNLKRARQVCPTADDIWFWAHVHKTGAAFQCLGLRAHRPIRLLSKSNSTSLSAINAERNNIQFQTTLDALGIRAEVETNAFPSRRPPSYSN